MDANETAELARYRQEAASSTVAAAIAVGLAGHVVNDAAASQLTRILESDVRLVEVDGKRVAVGPGGQPVKDYVAAQLVKPEYSHFIRAEERRAAGQPTTTPAEMPKTLGDAIRRHVSEQLAVGADGSTNFRVPGGRPPMPMEPVKG